MSTFHSQLSTVVLIGILADRPLATSVQKEGVFYFSTNTVETYISVIVAGVMTWVLQSSPGGGGPAIPLNEIAFGTGASITSNPAFTFDPSLANILTLKDTSLTTIMEAGGLTGAGRFFNIVDNAGFPLLACDAIVGGPNKRQVVIGDEAGHSLVDFFTLTADLFVRFGEPGGTFLRVDMKNRIIQAFSSSGESVWEVGWDAGKPLTFPNIATATASNLGFHANGQSAFIESVLKFGELPGFGSGALCYFSFSGPGGTGWYTGDNHIAAE